MLGDILLAIWLSKMCAILSEMPTYSFCQSFVMIGKKIVDFLIKAYFCLSPDSPGTHCRLYRLEKPNWDSHSTVRVSIRLFQSVGKRHKWHVGIYSKSKHTWCNFILKSLLYRRHLRWSKGNIVKTFPPGTLQYKNL